MRKLALTLLAVFLVPHLALAQTKLKRAKLPDFPPDSTQGVFFDNVFEEGLQGPRPANLGQPLAVAAGGASSGTSAPAAASTGETASGGGLYPWSKIISAASIEDEVKALKLAADQSVTTPTKFAGGDFKTVRRDFSMLAMLFAIVAEYDGEVRWKDSAPAARDLFARTAGNAKVGTVQVYNEAKLRRDQLGDLLNGLKIEGQAEPKAKWGEVTDRAPLMQKLDLAFNGKVLPATSNAAEFKANQSELKQQAELIAAVAEVLKQEGMEDASDADYQGHSDKMKSAALEIVRAIQDNNPDAASKAAGQIGQACDQCHESYRG